MPKCLESDELNSRCYRTVCRQKGPEEKKNHEDDDDEDDDDEDDDDDDAADAEEKGVRFVHEQDHTEEGDDDDDDDDDDFFKARQCGFECFPLPLPYFFFAARTPFPCEPLAASENSNHPSPIMFQHPV